MEQLNVEHRAKSKGNQTDTETSRTIQGHALRQPRDSWQGRHWDEREEYKRAEEEMTQEEEQEILIRIKGGQYIAVNDFLRCFLVHWIFLSTGTTYLKDIWGKMDRNNAMDAMKFRSSCKSRKNILRIIGKIRDMHANLFQTNEFERCKKLIYWRLHSDNLDFKQKLVLILCRLWIEAIALQGRIIASIFLMFVSDEAIQVGDINGFILF